LGKILEGFQSSWKTFDSANEKKARNTKKENCERYQKQREQIRMILKTSISFDAINQKRGGNTFKKLNRHLHGVCSFDFVKRLETKKKEIREIGQSYQS